MTNAQCPVPATSRNRLLGWLLVGAGVIGVLTGAVPFIINTARIGGGEAWWRASDWAGHGVEAMGLSVEWGMLSSAMGLCLGFLLLWAGACWLRGLDHAPAVTWAYVLAGLTVNVADMYIFALRARPGPMRNSMLWADGAALTLPVILGVWLTLKKRN